MNEMSQLKREVGDFITNVGWTHKIQACQADLYFSWDHILNVLRIFFEGITTAGIVTMFFEKFNGNIIILICSLLFSIASMVITMFYKELSYYSKGERCKQMSNYYFHMRESAKDILYHLNTGVINLEEAKKELLKLKIMRRTYNIFLPEYRDKARKLAEKRIEMDQLYNFKNRLNPFISDDLIS